MDLRMPRMDGLEALRLLRQREGETGRPPTVVIAMTASVLDLDLGPLQQAGFTDLMAKPFPEGELMDKLHRHCGLALAPDLPLSQRETADLSASLAGLDPAWAEAFDRTLILGDREEGMDLLRALADPILAEALSAHLREFRFDILRDLLASRRPHA
jgi:CheY-like chemotaxis protein